MHNRIYTVIEPLFVASGRAASAILCLEILQRHLKLSIGKGIPDSPFLVRGMHIVACPAGSPLFLFYMEDVKVRLTVPEVGHRCGLLNGQHRLGVAEKTEVILARDILRIKLVRK